MSAKLLIHILLALLALVAGEPFHLWVHGEQGVVYAQHHEIHDGACEHQPEHRDADHCLLCLKGHGNTVTLQRSSVALEEPALGGHVAHETLDAARVDPLAGVLGARAPPTHG